MDLFLGIFLICIVVPSSLLLMVCFRYTDKKSNKEKVYCKNCKHCLTFNPNDIDSYKCKLTEEVDENLVTGEKTYTYENCEEERDDDGSCGEDGKNYKMKV